VYLPVARKFPQIREEDLLETLSSGGNRWQNRLQWARQNLVIRGDVDSPSHGVWRITEQGQQRVAGTDTPPPLPPPPASFLELYEDYEEAFRSQLLERLHDLSPREFEQFGRRLLRAYGFVDVNVTQYGKDGGIDGYGSLRLGLATMRAAFQCKRWQGNVSRTEVDKFRGAIQGEFEQGVFFTTADFTSDARDASLKAGAVPIILFNGQSIVDIMIDKGLGVERVPLYAFYERLGDLELDDE
jgi:restriction system protein